MTNEILTIILPVITGVVAWIARGKKRNNDFIHELQRTINMLIEENAKLIAEQIEIKKQNAQSLDKLERLSIENGNLRKQIEELSKKINKS